ncbi:DUF6796 family protein [Colwellia sp. TT2012]|uniref:DUF6796 family protein n=1 Tax=Colwellia sp. TT2012 TaxID=1720342 RepID=UPI00070B9A8B|nr:DUF6796 family protein [Colwellia sp. TT2012]
MEHHSNNLISPLTAIWLGFSGILGSLVLFSGDMLFYYNGAQTNIISNMSVVSSERIIISGISALISAWLYTLASGQIYFAFQPAKKWVRLTVSFSFLAVMISFGIVHAAYIAIATSAKNAVELGVTPNSLTDLAVSANNALRLLAYIPFGVFSILFATTVWTKKTYYPRWLILFNPIIPFLLADLIVSNLEGEIKVIIGGGYLNLILLLFFSCSTFALWRNRIKADIKLQAQP